MAVRMVWQGAWRVFADTDFRLLIKKLAQRRYRSQDDQVRMVAAALEAHQYLIFDPRIVAERRYEVQRLAECRVLLRDLVAGLNDGSVRSEGIEGATGQAALTPDKLRGHGLRMLNVGDAFLLLRLDRHPTGGRGAMLAQYWLYSRQAATVTLLAHREDVPHVNFHATLVDRSDGTWQRVSEDLGAKFRDLVNTLLGADLAATLMKAAETIEGELLAPLPDAVNDECRTITGLDVGGEEARRAAEREAAYTAEFGPPKGPSGIAVGFPQFRISSQRAPKDDHSQER